MMFHLYFDGDNSRKLGDFDSYGDAYDFMSNFLHEAEKNNNFHWWYTRVTINQNERRIDFDVSSHTEFLFIICDTDEELEKVIAKL